MSTGNAIQHVLVMQGLTPIQVKVGVYLVGRANGRRFCWATVEDMMVDLDIDSNRTVSTATMELAKRDVFRVVRHRRGTNHYYISDWLYDVPVVLPSSRLRDKDVHPAAHQGPEDVQPAAHQEAEDVQPVAREDVQLVARKDVQPVAHPLTQARDSREDSSKLPPNPPPGGSRAPGRAESEHPRFAEFYGACHRKEGRRHASRAFTAALSRGADPDDIITAMRRQIPNPNPRYRKLPATWLNGDCWKDEAPPSRDERLLEIVGLKPSWSFDDPPSPPTRPSIGRHVA
jgi:hypothetical protein